MTFGPNTRVFHSPKYQIWYVVEVGRLYGPLHWLPSAWEVGSIYERANSGTTAESCRVLEDRR